MAKQKRIPPTMPNVNNYEFIGVNTGGGGFILGKVKVRWNSISDATIEHLLNLDNELWSRYWKKKKKATNKDTD